MNVKTSILLFIGNRQKSVFFLVPKTVLQSIFQQRLYNQPWNFEFLHLFRQLCQPDLHSGSKTGCLDPGITVSVIHFLGKFYIILGISRKIPEIPSQKLGELLSAFVFFPVNLAPDGKQAVIKEMRVDLLLQLL